MEKAKEAIIEQLNYCKEIAEDIIKNNASMEILQHAKKFAEIESPMTGETEATWVRICWGDIYIFLRFDEAAWDSDGKINFTEIVYQLDPIGGYGAELIDVNTVEEFMEKLSAITEEALVAAHYGEYFPVSPEPYKEYVA